MDKRRMLSFDEKTQLFIETAASGAALFCAYKMMQGYLSAAPGTPARKVFVGAFLLFAVGGAAGLVKTYLKYRRQRRQSGGEKRQ